MCESYNLQYGTNYIAVMPTNLYGPNDNFHLENSHVMPAMMRKIYLAKLLHEGDWHSIEEDMNKRPINPTDKLRALIGEGNVDSECYRSFYNTTWCTPLRTDEALSTTNCATSKGLATTTTATCTFIANTANAPFALTACNCPTSTCPTASAPTTFHSSSKVCVPNVPRGSARAEYTQARNSSTELKRRTQAQSSSAELKHKVQAQNSSTNGGDASRVGKRRNKELNPTLSTDAGRVAPIRDWLPHRHNKKSAFQKCLFEHAECAFYFAISSHTPHVGAT